MEVNMSDVDERFRRLLPLKLKNADDSYAVRPSTLLVSALPSEYPPGVVPLSRFRPLSPQQRGHHKNLVLNSVVRSHQINNTFSACFWRDSFFTGLVYEGSTAKSSTRFRNRRPRLFHYIRPYTTSFHRRSRIPNYAHLCVSGAWTNLQYSVFTCIQLLKIFQFSNSLLPAPLAGGGAVLTPSSLLLWLLASPFYHGCHRTTAVWCPT